MRAALLPAVLLAAFAAASPAVHAQGYALDASHTFVHWEVLHMGTSTTRGRFDRAGGSIRFDAKAKLIELGITIDIASVNTGLAPFDKMLRGEPFLAAEAHPQAFFTAKNAQWEGDAPRLVNGEFTLRGISQPLALRALRWHCGLNPIFRREVCGGDFEAELRRSAFGITHSLPLVADKVRLLIQVEAVATPQ